MTAKAERVPKGRLPACDIRDGGMYNKSGAQIGGVFVYHVHTDRCLCTRNAQKLHLRSAHVCFSCQIANIFACSYIGINVFGAPFFKFKHTFLVTNNSTPKILNSNLELVLELKIILWLFRQKFYCGAKLIITP